MDVPVDLKVMWTSPHGSMLTTNNVMKSFSLYTSKVVLGDIGLADAGLYTCKVSIGSDISTSAQRDIQIGKSIFNKIKTLRVSVRLFQ